MGVCAIFGGSFDPPHVGHVLAASYVLSVGMADRVLVVPVFEHAFQKDLTPFEDRLALCRLAFAGESRVQVSDIERELDRPSYTLGTVLALRERMPDEKLRVLMGADAFAETPKWHRYAELAKLAPPLVLGRVGSTVRGAPSPVLPDVSSSAVRQWLSDGQRGEQREILAQLVPHEVLTEIERRGLYRGP